MNEAYGLTGSSQLPTVANGIATRFEEQNIPLPQSVQERISKILISNFSNKPQLTTGDVEDFFTEYLDIAEE